MDVMLLSTATAFGLAGSAGLNTTLPLLIVAILARFNLLALNAPYDALATDFTIAALLVLVVIEIAGDKLPVVDHVLHAVQWPVSSAAGAILFASQTSVIADVSPGLAIVIGLLTAGTVHGARTMARPVVTNATVGTGNPVVSAAEDGAAVALVGTAVTAPLISALLLVCLLVGLGVGSYAAFRTGRSVWGRIRRWRTTTGSNVSS